MFENQYVRFHAVRKAFEKQDSEYGVIENISFELSAGTCLSLIGENGSGKSTILRMACGLISPDEGAIETFGGDPIKDGRVRGRIGAMFEGGRAMYARMTPKENVAYFAAMKGFDGRDALARFDHYTKHFSIAHYQNVVVRKLSRGTQQKFSLICSLATGADLWLLDEPTLGMDTASISLLMEMIAQHTATGGSVLMATHDAAFAAALGPIKRMSDFDLNGPASTPHLIFLREARKVVNGD